MPIRLGEMKMRKKLQVFISSTFTDLKDERQAAVQAVLNAGHIPAGMELFKSGDESQKETIKKWIQESDVYMLILGGRYGTLEEESGKSYTHWEYYYAEELGKPRFAIVITDEALREKIKIFGPDVMEIDNAALYKAFKEQVLSKTSTFFNDLKDIQLSTQASLREYESNPDLSGWVSGKEAVNQTKLLEKNFSLLEENQKLKDEIEGLKNKLVTKEEINGFAYKEILDYLSKNNLTLPEAFDELSGEEIPLLNLLISGRNKLTIGIQNSVGMDDRDNFYFFRVAPKLISLGLLEKVKVAGAQYQRIQLSKHGLKFLGLYDLGKH